MIFLFALPVITPAQVITSAAMTVFPGTANEYTIFDTTTISISSEANTIQIVTNNVTKTHLIKSVVIGENAVTYYLEEPKGIYSIEIRAKEPGQFVFITFENDRDHPMRLTNLTFY